MNPQSDVEHGIPNSHSSAISTSKDESIANHEGTATDIESNPPTASKKLEQDTIIGNDGFSGEHSKNNNHSDSLSSISTLEACIIGLKGEPKANATKTVAAATAVEGMDASANNHKITSMNITGNGMMVSGSGDKFRNALGPEISERVESLGEIDPRPTYHTENEIWPVGFTKFATYSLDPTLEETFKFEILDGGDEGPLFRVTYFPPRELAELVVS
jgi:hypothetical protein